MEMFFQNTNIGLNAHEHIFGNNFRTVNENFYEEKILRWEPNIFQDAFRIWFREVIKKENEAQSFKKKIWRERIGMEPRRFSWLKNPNDKLYHNVRLDDIVRIANGLNTSPSDILREVAKKYDSLQKESGRVPGPKIKVKKNRKTSSM